MQIGALAGLLFAAIVISGCASRATSRGEAGRVETAVPGAVLASLAVDSAAEDRILALVPERISDQDLRDTLSQGPAPRIILVQGSLPLVTMQPFAEFLIAMGYPEARIRNPSDGAYSYSG